MSSHHLSASGKRELSTTINGDARTSAQVPSKEGDAAALTLSGFGRIEIGLGTSARIERRRTSRKLSSTSGDDVQYYEQNVLVIESPEGSAIGTNAYCTPTDGPAGPHTSVDVRRHDPDKPGGWWFDKDHEVLEVVQLNDMAMSKEDSRVVAE